MKRKEISESIDDAVTCAICMSVIHDPVHFDCSCKKSVCRMCADEWKTESCTCPSCAEEIEETVDCCRQWGFFLDCQLRGCGNSEECKHRKMNYEDMLRHEEEECIHRLVTCPNELCRQKIPLKNIKSHLKLCRLKRCKNYCGAYSRGNVGCPFVGSKLEVKQHEKNCDYKPEIVRQIKNLLEKINED